MRYLSPLFILISCVCLMAPLSARAPESVTGIPRIVDGDTVEISRTKIRLLGIDAPETDQLCLSATGDKWACGITARDELIKLSAGRPWDCDLAGVDRYGRSLGKCFVDGDDVSEWMARHGWALSFVRYSHTYDAVEVAAKSSLAGLWAGAFVAPWDWRHRNGKTLVMGARSVPVDAQKILLGAVSAENAPSPDCTIKAAVSRGKCIYHLPGDRWYAKMNMNIGKRWFCSVTDAEAAGCRAAKL